MKTPKQLWAEQVNQDQRGAAGRDIFGDGSVTLATLAAVEKELGGSQYQGFTRHVIADSDMVTLELMIRPDTDLDSTYEAWDCDALELIRVNGWLFSVEEA